MPPSPPNSNTNQGRHHHQHHHHPIIVERTLRTCEPCRRRKRQCNGVKPCTHCIESHIDCVYSVVSDVPRSVFTTSTARRLSSGSACETCRRRKTKCDGGSPCGFCASAGIDCINNSERRKRAMGIPATSGTNATYSAAATPSVAPPPDPDAIERIEDRLRRIEKLMTAFTPAANSPLATSTRPMLSSSPPPSSSSGRRMIRHHRHSVQGISVAKEQAELRTAYALKKRGGMSPPPSTYYDTNTSNNSNNVNSAIARYATPPNSGGKAQYNHQNHASSPSPPPSSLSPIMRQNSTTTQPITSSMFNLTLSPSSSTTSSTSNNSSMMIPPLTTPQSSMSAPPMAVPPQTQNHYQQQHAAEHQPTMPRGHYNTGGISSSSENEWKIATSTSMPSLMDQLSKRTFGTTPAFTFPPYPLTPSPQHQQQHPPPTISSPSSTTTIE
ncbi:hypothetical protein K492DRAFT_209635 [Lichtheimia hyalospora FSU 10163]|nr:hypothetical protein K492DRAFT_209635 [Lichtheimia hyalospora FSU 10163]